MRGLIRFLSRLYPTAWRERYGAEFAALLEDVEPDWRTLLDIVKGALEMRMGTWNLATISATTGLIGALVALGVSFVMPLRYASVAVLRISPPAQWGPTLEQGQAMKDSLMRLTNIVESPASLVSVINSVDLYKDERARMPIEDVVQDMKKKISIAPVIPRISGPKPKRMAVAIRFESDNPVTAQTVTRDLVARFLEQNIRDAASTGPMIWEQLDPATLPRTPFFPPRPLITISGLVTGLAMGGILAIIRHFLKPTQVLC